MQYVVLLTYKMKGAINMTRKHYVLIADAIKENILYDPKHKNNGSEVDLRGLIYSLRWRLKGDNDKFDGDKFKDYINGNL